jgi:nucleoid-associated protein YgaU
VTPAIVISGVFLAACAVFAIAFVGARGGLQMPVAASHRPVAVGSELPTAGSPSLAVASPASSPAASIGPTLAPPTLPPATPAPTIVPPPTAAPTAPAAGPTLAPGDPLLTLPPCGTHLACREYRVVRGDTLSGIISRYRLDIDVLQALNPGHLLDPSLIVTNQLIYLGRDPLARLDPCPGGEACAIYVVQSGDTVSGIAARYLLTTDAILAANPGLPRPIQPGQEIRLPR